MAKLTHTIEKSKRLQSGAIQNQRLDITVQADQHGDFQSYQDADANLYIDGVFVAEIGHLLSKADVFINLVDNINWPELAEAQKEEIES